MKYYQLTYLISPDLSEEEIKLLQEKINSLIQGEGGTLGKGEGVPTGRTEGRDAIASRPAGGPALGWSPAKKKLGYLIGKKSTAFLGQVSFHLIPEKIENLEKKLKEAPQILRYLILARQALRPSRPEAKKPPKLEVPTKKIPKPKVELKEIEKKLEEILGETNELK